MCCKQRLIQQIPSVVIHIYIHSLWSAPLLRDSFWWCVGCGIFYLSFLTSTYRQWISLLIRIMSKYITTWNHHHTNKSNPFIKAFDLTSQYKMTSSIKIPLTYHNLSLCLSISSSHEHPRIWDGFVCLFRFYHITSI